jgi:hypothetical protein
MKAKPNTAVIYRNALKINCWAILKSKDTFERVSINNYDEVKAYFGHQLEDQHLQLPLIERDCGVNAATTALLFGKLLNIHAKQRSNLHKAIEKIGERIHENTSEKVIPKMYSDAFEEWLKKPANGGMKVGRNRVLFSNKDGELLIFYKGTRRWIITAIVNNKYIAEYNWEIVDYLNLFDKIKII